MVHQLAVNASEQSVAAEGHAAEKAVDGKRQRADGRENRAFTDFPRAWIERWRSEVVMLHGLLGGAAGGREPVFAME